MFFKYSIDSKQPGTKTWLVAREIFSFKIRKCQNLLITWVGFLVAQKQSGALG